MIYHRLTFSYPSGEPRLYDHPICLDCRRVVPSAERWLTEECDAPRCSPPFAHVFLRGALSRTCQCGAEAWGPELFP